MHSLKASFIEAEHNSSGLRHDFAFLSLGVRLLKSLTYYVDCRPFVLTGRCADESVLEPGVSGRADRGVALGLVGDCEGQPSRNSIGHATRMESSMADPAILHGCRHWPFALA